MANRPLLALLVLASLALAHEHGHGDEHGEMGIHNNNEHSNTPPSHSTSTGEDASYYFALAPHRGWLYLHILTMLFSWVIVMPLG